MSRLFEASLLHGSEELTPRGWSTETAAERSESGHVRLGRYLPLVVLTTASVVLLPGALVAAFVPRGGVLLIAASATLAVAISLAIASVEAALWTRRRRARDLVFAELMLWGWVRRCWTERRLAQARELYESAKRAGPTVSIELLERLSQALEARDPNTHGHSRRVARHAARIAGAMGLSASETAKVRTAAMVHDVGKLYTPRAILNKPGRLTDREFAIVKLHAGDGADMLADVGDPEIAAMVRHHHERIDGHGYPDGLVGLDIPLGARIIAVADTFDAITSNRPYRPAATHKQALDILAHEASSQLDGAAVAAFQSRYSARRSVAWLALAAAVPERILMGLQAASSSFGVGAAGTTSILPAIGAAGLLAFSPGLHHAKPVDQRAHRRHEVTRSHLRTLAVVPTTAVARRAKRARPRPYPISPAHQRGRGALPGVHGKTTPRHPTEHSIQPSAASKPSLPTSTTAAGSPEPAPTAPTTSSPPPSLPTTTTSPVAPPPAGSVPALPEVPISVPVPLPSLPLPPVSSLTSLLRVK
jgi:putative nucleotidyltransferase with HDIG domain